MHTFWTYPTQNVKTVKYARPASWSEMEVIRRSMRLNDRSHYYCRKPNEEEITEAKKSQTPRTWTRLLLTALSEKDISLAFAIAKAHSFKIGQDVYLPFKMVSPLGNASGVMHLGRGDIRNGLFALWQQGVLKSAELSDEKDLSFHQKNSKWFRPEVKGLKGEEQYFLRRMSPGEEPATPEPSLKDRILKIIPGR